MAREGELKKKPKEAPAAPSLGNFLPVRTEAKTKMPVGETEEKKILGNLGYAKRGMGKRIPLNELKKNEKETLLFPAKFLEGMGVEIPEFGKDSIFVTTGPNNGKFINSRGENFSFVLSGDKILYSINDSPRESMSKKGLGAA